MGITDYEIYHISIRVAKNIFDSEEFMKEIYHKYCQIPEENRADYLKEKLLEVLFLLSQMRLSAGCGEENDISSAQLEIVKNVTEYISVHLSDKILLKELTSHFGISDTYLQKLFHTVYGMPVAAFIRTQKMQEAARLLIETDGKVEDIAAEVGYLNVSKFSAVFKKIMGDSPSAYRKKCCFGVELFWFGNCKNR